MIKLLKLLITYLLNVPRVLKRTILSLHVCPLYAPGPGYFLLSFANWLNNVTRLSLENIPLPAPGSFDQLDSAEYLPTPGTYLALVTMEPIYVLSFLSLSSLYPTNCF